MNLTSLPGEVHLAICSQLDYVSLTMISNINKYFQELVLDHKCLRRNALVAHEEHIISNYSPIDRVRTRERQLIPCYNCLKCLPRDRFDEHDLPMYVKSKNRRNYPLQWLRLCMTCSLPELKQGPTKIFHPVVDDSAFAARIPNEWDDDSDSEVDISLGGFECEVSWLYCEVCKIARRIFGERSGFPRDTSVSYVVSMRGRCYDCWLSLSKKEREQVCRANTFKVKTRRGMDFIKED